MCQAIPPVARTGESCSSATKALSEKERNTSPLAQVVCEPEWLEKGIHSLASRFAKPYPKDHRTELAPHLVVNRYKPEPPERDERWTDRFHLSRILEPAAVIAASMLGKEVQAGFAPSQNDTVGDLIVTVAEGHCITAESKRGLVFTTHLPAFLAVARLAKFPWPARTKDPTEAIRMWIQIWAQMLEYNALYAKVFSPLGAIYIYRNPSKAILYHSRVYDNMDDEVLRSTALIILAQSPPAAPLVTRVISAVVGRPIVQSIFSWFMEAVIHVALIVGAVCGSRGIGVRTAEGFTLFYPVGKDAIFPVVFSTRLGSGASGIVFRSADGQHVLKVFTDEEKACNEATVLRLCLDHPEIRAPEFQGLYSNSHNFGIVMSYAGTAMKDIFSAPDDQKQQLVSILKALHGKDIHHHDVRAENIMVNHRGVVTLVDFDRAVIVDGRCSYCPDLEMIAVLERSMGIAQGYETCYL
ncbi:hypothetical protein B0H11DRAFT_2099297 [Mycena galericulata]|nr:hypothetical protein B0H11DRAFT_2099297 [Mycena galericulata]